MKISWSKNSGGVERDKFLMSLYFDNEIDFNTLKNNLRENNTFVDATKKEFDEYMKTLGWFHLGEN